jgi:AcrR family transcriptional regulator
MSRGREQKTRDVVAAAMKIADREGFEAVSMRRVAAELDVGTMSLYSYVKSKDELLTLMSDAIGREMLLEEVPADWREALRAVARRTREMMLRHPWVMTIRASPPAQMPESFLHHVDQSLQALAGLDADVATKGVILRAVDALTEGTTIDDYEEEHGQAPVFGVEWMREVAERDGLVHLAGSLDEISAHESAFEYGLDLLIAGIEATVRPKRGASRSRATRR